MRGYAASARLERVPVRTRVGRSDPTGLADVGMHVDRDPRPLGERFRERIDELRETWDQTTFYLFDPESWR